MQSISLSIERRLPRSSRKESFIEPFSLGRKRKNRRSVVCNLDQDGGRSKEKRRREDEDSGLR